MVLIQQLIDRRLKEQDFNADREIVQYRYFQLDIEKVPFSAPDSRYVLVKERKRLGEKFGRVSQEAPVKVAKTRLQRPDSTRKKLYTDLYSVSELYNAAKAYHMESYGAQEEMLYKQRRIFDYF